MMNFVMLSVVVINVAMLSVIMLSVVAHIHLAFIIKLFTAIIVYITGVVYLTLLVDSTLA